MLIGYFKPYKGLKGTICIDLAPEVKHYGRVLVPNDKIKYSANAFEDLEVQFHKAVDDYLKLKEG